MVENVIAFFSTTTKPKVTIFDNKSNSIRFYGHLWSRQFCAIQQSRYMVHQNLYTILEAGPIF